LVDPFVDVLVTIIVEAITALGAEWVSVRVAVVTIGLGRVAEPAGVVAVSVCVREPFIDVSVAVIVDAVATLFSSGEDEGIVIVAVAVANGVAVAIGIGCAEIAHPISRVANLVRVGAHHICAQIPNLTSTVLAALAFATDDVVTRIDDDIRVSWAGWSGALSVGTGASV
jgi:hypothetical protein